MNRGIGLDLVVRELPHEDFLVDGLRRVIEQLRDARRVAEQRALPRHERSDFGESSLPSTDMPDICTSPAGFPAASAFLELSGLLAAGAEALAGFIAETTAAVRGAAASSAKAAPLATRNE